MINNLVVLSMGNKESDIYDLKGIVYQHDKPILFSENIVNHMLVFHDARVPEVLF